MRSIILAAACAVTVAVSSLVACGGGEAVGPDDAAAPDPLGSSGAPGSSGTSGNVADASADADASASADASADADAGVDASPDASAQCNSFASSAVTSIGVLKTDTLMPTAAGGTVVSGTYTLTAGKGHTSSKLVKNGTLLSSLGWTITVTGTAVQEIQLDDKSAVTRSTGTIAITGVDFVMTRSCIAPAASKVSATQAATYTATATTITLLSTVSSPIGPVGVELIFTKQ